MAGQFQQNGAAHHHASANHGGHSVDSGDAVMARWLQSAGLQHLAAPLAAAALDHRLLPSLLVQEYSRCGVQSLEDKQKLFRLIKTISSGDLPPEPSTPPAYSRSVGMDGFLSPELRGDVGAGILDLHSIDDTELFSEASIPEPFQSPPSFVPVIEKGFEQESEAYAAATKYNNSKYRGHTDASPLRSASNEKERNARDNSVARIKVVVRKRPINKKEIGRKEEDIIKIEGYKNSLTVHEPKLKVDLTAYVEKHEFVFDAVLDEDVSNEEVYRVTVEPIVPSIFQRTKATCFAYGQTGSGKTYTMQPLPLKASEDILNLMRRPSHRNEGFQLWLSFFEIYGGKLYDLLNDRRKLCMREDGRQQVCIVGLKEYRVSDVQLVRDYIDKGNSTRSTGSTGANEESSRSHAILQLAIKKSQDGGDGRGLRIAGKLSFIDLAGSERGADTTDNDRQTRMEGAEINKSLLALKECIRALDNDQGHIPFRGSKLTEVLRDSFVGDSRTVMISCISPNTGSCEHTLNTLRYADRVKGLSRNNNSKRDLGIPVVTQREQNTSPPLMRPPVPPTPDVAREIRPPENGRRIVEEVVWQRQNSDRDLYREREFYRERDVYRERDAYGEPDLHRDRDLPHDHHDLHSNLSIEYGFSGRGDLRGGLVPIEKERPYSRENYDSLEMNLPSATGSGFIVDTHDQGKQYVPVSSRYKVMRDEKSQRSSNPGLVKDAVSKYERASVVYRNSNRKDESIINSVQYGQKDLDVDTDYIEPEPDGHINAILEEEEEVICAHRKEVEDTMEIVREEMRLLAEVDQPGSQIDRYVAQLNHVLSRKAAGIVNLQARLAKFQRHLKEQEILGRTVGLR